jgi:hypothetical protein
MRAFKEELSKRQSWSEDGQGLQIGLMYGEALLRQALTTIFREVQYLPLVQVAAQLSSPQGLRALVEKTLIVVDPEDGQLRDFLECYSTPEGSDIKVLFQKSHFNDSLKLVVEDIPPPQESAS